MFLQIVSVRIQDYTVSQSRIRYFEGATWYLTAPIKTVSIYNFTSMRTRNGYELCKKKMGVINIRRVTVIFRRILGVHNGALCVVKSCSLG
jgi:hypothetical protein